MQKPLKKLKVDVLRSLLKDLDTIIKTYFKNERNYDSFSKSDLLTAIHGILDETTKDKNKYNQFFMNELEYLIGQSEDIEFELPIKGIGKDKWQNRVVTSENVTYKIINGVLHRKVIELLTDLEKNPEQFYVINIYNLSPVALTRLYNYLKVKANRNIYLSISKSIEKYSGG